VARYLWICSRWSFCFFSSARRSFSTFALLLESALASSTSIAYKRSYFFSYYFLRWGLIGVRFLILANDYIVSVGIVPPGPPQRFRLPPSSVWPPIAYY
jgi:hypothetical protein